MDLSIVIGIVLVVLMVLGIMPILATVSTSISVSDALTTLGQHGYVAYANPTGTLIVTGDINCSGDANITGDVITGDDILVGDDAVIGGNVTVTGNINPASNNTGALGNSTLWIASGYVTDLHANTLTVNGNLTTNGIGVTSRGTVTQATSVSTGVTLNNKVGTITTYAHNGTAGNITSFTVTCGNVTTDDIVYVCIADTNTNPANSTMIASVDDISAGSFDVVMYWVGPAASNDTFVLNYILIDAH